ncbi:MAG: alpha/beta fold hydrolase [Gemmatimonas sp.]
MARTKTKSARKPAKSRSATRKVVKTARKIAAKLGAKPSAAKAPKKRSSFVTLFGMKIEVERRGRGRPLVLIPGEDALEADLPFVDELARSFEVIIPWMPGFGRSERPDWVENMDDVAYIFLDLLDALKLKDVTLVGFSLGGWIAAEMAIKNTSRIKKLVLVDAYGIKVGGKRDRDIADVWYLPAEKVLELKYVDPDKGKFDYPSMPDEKLEIIARNRETTARLCWDPYMHHPRLYRRLHRIDVPTLVLWGEKDGVVTTDYGRAYAKAIKGAKFASIPNAAHFPHVEAPEKFMKELSRFVR